ncbi:MAG: hypothetical protein MJ158_00995 [Alphaproteobacteria bacterium]|nr:hypothetical protein [Alphaproteobacteria bacterium]
MLNQLTITNFRNHSNSRINISDKKHIIITGPNEAISMLAGDRGLRGVDMQTISKFDGDGNFYVVVTTDDDSTISVFFNSNDSSRKIKIDNDYSSFTEIAKKVKLVWLTPHEDGLFTGPVSDRRSFFDRLTANFEPAHLGRLNRINKLMSERTAALKTSFDNTWLDVLDKQISATAIAISSSRIRYAGELNYFFETGAVSVNGFVENLLLKNTGTIAEQLYFEYLQQNRELINDKMLIEGTHKSDFGVFNKVLKLPVNITSMGQQKSILIDLILSHSKLLNIKTGISPIILLDEAVTFLDTTAKQNIFKQLDDCNAQIFITGIDKNIFADIPNALFVSCQNGSISNIV